MAVNRHEEFTCACMIATSVAVRTGKGEWKRRVLIVITYTGGHRSWRWSGRNSSSFSLFLPFPTYLPLHVDDTCHTDPGAEGWELGATSATSSGGQNQWTKSVSFPSSVPATSTLVDKGANGLLIDGEKYWIQLSDYLRELLPRCRRRCNLPSPIAPFHYLRKT